MSVEMRAHSMSVAVSTVQGGASRPSSWSQLASR